MVGLIVIILSFFYFYTPELVFLPVSVRVMLGSAGILLFLILETSKLIKYREKKILDIGGLVICGVFLLIILSGIGFGILNGVFDADFIKDFLVKIMVLFGASYLIFYFIRVTGKRITYTTPINIIIIITSVQSVISLAMFLSPSIKMFFDSIQKVSENPTMLNLLARNITSYRILGFGTSFFGAGLEVTFCLLAIVAIVRGKEFVSVTQMFGYVLAFMLNTCVGVLMARTTFVGLAVSLAFLFFPYGRTTPSRQFGNVLFILLGILIMLVLANLSNPQAGFIMFAFEALINLQEGNGLITDSSEDLKTMYLWPNDIKTYLLGHGLLNDPQRLGAYYMGIDVGYLRLIYFGGIIFLLLWFWSHFSLLRRSLANLSRASKVYAPFIIAVILFLIIANAKGLSDYFTHLIFIYTFSIMFKDSFIESQEMYA